MSREGLTKGVLKPSLPEAEAGMKDATNRHSTQKFLSDDQGLSTPEYALMLGLIILVCIGSLELLSTGMNQAFNSVEDKLGQKGSVARGTPAVANAKSGP